MTSIQLLWARARSIFEDDASRLPSDVRAAARAFAKKRYAYFENLAGMIEAVDGKMNYLTMFERDAARYVGTPRGRLTAYWIQRMHETGAKLSETWIGSVPTDELAMIAIAEKRGRGAMGSALRDLSRVGATVQAARKAFISTIAMSLVGVALATSMTLAMHFFFKPFFVQSFGFIPEEFYGSKTKAYYSTADFVGMTWWLVLPMLLALVGWVAWALPNWIGPGRRWSDENIIIFKLYRDFKGALFLATLASLTKSTGAEVTNQRNALLMMQSEVQPWLRWKIQEMLARMDDAGALDATIFDVGVVEKEVFYRISDIFEARGLSEGLSVAGRESEDRAVEAIGSRGKMIRTLMMGGALATVLSLLLWVYAVVIEFKSAIGFWSSQ